MSKGGLTLMDSKPYARFNVLVVEAEKLPNRDDVKGPSAACRITYEGNKGNVSLVTDAFPNHVRPKWYEEFTIYMDDLAKPIKFFVKNTTNDDKLGRVIIDPLSLKPNNRYDQWLDLEMPGQKQAASSGYVAVPTGPENGGRLHLVYSIVPLSILPGDFDLLSGKEAPFRMILRSGDLVKSGDYVEGDVVFMTPRPYPLEKVFIRIYGIEKVEWNEIDDSGLNEKYTGSNTLINKWYHGWKSDTGGDIPAGYYMWHFRVKVPENLPPFFRDTIGEISYFLHAYLDHDRYTRGIPLRVTHPIVQSVQPEKEITKHNLNVHAVLDKPVYYVDEIPLHMNLDITIKDLSDYNVRHVKVRVIETSTYAADTNVAELKRVLFKSAIASGSFSFLGNDSSNAVQPHRTFRKTVPIDLPNDHQKPTQSKFLGSTRIHIEHKVEIKVVKDTLNTHRVVLEVPFYVTTKDVLIEEKRQVISLVSAANVVTPPTPVQKRRNKKSKINKPIFDDDDEEPTVSKPSLQPFKSDPFTFDTKPVMPSPTSNTIELLGFSSSFNPFTNPNNLPMPAFSTPTSVAAPTFLTHFSGGASSSTTPFPAVNQGQVVQFDSIPSTFTSMNSVSLYNADPNIKAASTSSTSTAFDSQPASNPFVNAEFSNPFTGEKTPTSASTPNRPFDINGATTTSPGQFSTTANQETRLPQSGNKGYETL